jgi:hypothetical protein
MRNGAPRRKGPTEGPALKIDRGGGKGGHLMARLGGRFATVPTSSGELPRERCGRFCVSSGPGSAAGPARSGQQPGRSIFVRHSLDVQDHLQFVRAPNAPTTRRSPGDLCTAQVGEKRGSRLIRRVLRHEASLERGFQDRLVEGNSRSQIYGVKRLHVLSMQKSINPGRRF